MYLISGAECGLIFQSRVLDQSMGGLCDYRNPPNVRECCSDRQTDQSHEVSDPAGCDPPARTHRITPPTLPALIPSSQSISSINTEIESAISTPNKQSFSTQSAQPVHSIFSLRAHAAREMRHSRKPRCCLAAQKAAIHAGRSEDQ